MHTRDHTGHTREQADAMFVELFQQLNAQNVTYETIPHVLETICKFFSLGCAFIYERDHTKTFLLRENYSNIPDVSLPESFQLEGMLTDRQILRFAMAPVLFVNKSNGLNPLQMAFAKLFDASTLLLFPIVDDKRVVQGCVGVMDRRNNSSMDGHDLQLARTIFSAVGNRVRLRIYQQRLAYTQASMNGIMDNTGIDIYVNDFDTHEILYVNRSMAAPYGGMDSMIGKPCYSALYEGRTEECDYCPRNKIIDENGKPTKIFSWDYERPFDGSWFRVLSAAFPWVDGRIAHVISSVDITEGKHYEQMVEQMAYMDTLTGIPNRRMLEKDFGEYIAQDATRPATLLFVDLDNFKSINDTLGHSAGDELLIQVASCLSRHVKGLGKAYRHGGDEFILFIEGQPDDLRELVECILDESKKGFMVLGAPHRCTFSIGVVRYPEHGKDFNRLLESSDQTMYLAKQNGKAKAVF
ncbi:sensor domain-containing diguanylate cyclase, partial [Eubacteriales bacterium OttesenSCG-928-N13]|nr:sensor domain-containing diguanylate cyclase [Eubacteriales bacterium OttesenSCG-928-N13]